MGTAPSFETEDPRQSSLIARDDANRSTAAVGKVNLDPKGWKILAPGRTTSTKEDRLPGRHSRRMAVERCLKHSRD